MRKIVHTQHGHNGSRRVAGAAAAATALMAASLLAGCGGNSTADKPGAEASAPTAAATPDAVRGCDVVIDTSGWRAFRDLTERIAAREPVSREDMIALGDEPAFTAWREALPPPVPPAMRIANWLEAAFPDELGHEDEGKRSRERYMMSTLYRYDFDHRDDIDARIARLAPEDRACEIARLVRRWVTADSIPSPLLVRVLPAKSEVRLHDGVVYFDASVFAAVGLDQFVRHVASFLYRQYEAPQGPLAHTQQGDEAVLQTIRTMMVEGVAHWIDDLPSMRFADDHPQFDVVDIVPEQFFQRAQDALEILDQKLSVAFADTAYMRENGIEIAKTMVARNAIIGTGYAMAAVIAERLGEDRLAAVRTSPPDFLAAFQEAAAGNAKPPLHPGEPGVTLAECVPALDPHVYAELHARLQARFGSSS